MLDQMVLPSSIESARETRRDRYST
jgi:hypothetical protein